MIRRRISLAYAGLLIMGLSLTRATAVAIATESQRTDSVATQSQLGGVGDHH